MTTFAIRVFPFGLLSCALSLAASAASPVGDNSEDGTPLTYEHHIRPILKAMCFHCHGEAGEVSGGLDLRLVRLMASGGESGSAIVPGDVGASLLWRRIQSDEMPEGPKKLTSEQKELVRRWIAEGAATARPEPDNVADARFTPEELSHWAFQPVEPQVVPRPAGFDLVSPIDGFVAARLAGEGFSFSPPADRRTLIRRAAFDLTGLPPTPEEVEAFANDAAPDAYERLIDRLLTSPHYGIRWGRHWLDTAGFAESDGGQEGDARRTYAWRYRDYVINAFNLNKPIDEFLREQLAGDEMVEGPLDAYNARQLELLTATGFLRMAPDPTQSSNTLADRNMAAADALKVISSTVMGLTIACAQCHDHKYEPIGADDYYAFRAIFDPVFPLSDWQQPSARLVDMTTSEVRGEVERIEAEAKSRHDELRRRIEAHAAEILEKKIADVPEELREAVRAAVVMPAREQTDEQQALLKQYPMVKPIPHIIGLLVEYDAPAYRAFEKEREAITEYESSKPSLQMVMASTERPGVVPPSVVFFRGDPESPGEPVAPSELAVLSRVTGGVAIPDDQGPESTTGRRLAFAEYLTNGRHPLTARVFVNRVWMHHFGRGLVATPGDFGLAGERPSHPELLDWLADDFVQSGWDLKRLHRLIMLSTTYQQQSQRSAAMDAVDPDNALLGRMNVRRLEAEAIRDAIFAVSGTLNDTPGGPSAPVTEDAEGKAVIGKPQTRDGLLAGVQGEGAAAARRSAFIEVQRSLPLNMLATFDQPEMNPNCEQRSDSTVATQALWFLNDSLIVEQSEALAARLRQSPEDDPVMAIHRLYQRLFAQVPTDDEAAACAEFLSSQAEIFRADPDPDWQTAIQKSPDALQTRALAALCQALLASNRFLYVD
ncbi:MAG: DUF1553 domain-containing protein [Planctomycetaceae bacterium]|nr:DUF1553 domain-containing protein [Planctomycetaceae bacterium]